MNKQKFKKNIDHVLDVFCKIFAYGSVLAIIIFSQFVLIGGLVYLADSRVLNREVLLCSLLLSFSTFFYGCSHIACRSYTYRKVQQSNGLSKYRKRAIENFLTGFILFLLSLGILLLTIFTEKIFW
jgi:hypothetical protein